jgi:hypothetical protein
MRGPAQVRLYDAVGNQVRFERHGDAGLCRVRLEGLSPGIYFCRVEADTGIRTGSLLIAR